MEASSSTASGSPEAPGGAGDDAEAAGTPRKETPSLGSPARWDVDWKAVAKLFAFANWTAFVAAACAVDLERAMGVLIATVCVVAAFLASRLMGACGDPRDLAAVRRAGSWTEAHPSAVLTVKVAVVVVCVGLWVASDIVPDPSRLVPAAGLLILVGATFAASRHRGAVNWRPVYSGIMLQVLLGMFILRTSIGHKAFMVAGDGMQSFLDHVEAGCRFVFGDDFEKFYIAFRVLPTVIYFSSIVSIGYYMGWLQHIFLHLSRIVRFVMGTSAIESVVAASNIFIGQSEAGVLVGPFLKDLTMSELHAVIACGFSTIAGSVLAVYMGFGVPADHLLAASVMSCPAALAMSKLSYPETEEVRVTVDSTEEITRRLDTSEHRNIIDAAAQGAYQGASLVVSIVANLIAFISIWSFLDSLLVEAGNLLNIEDLTCECLFSYVLWPVAALLGVPARDCNRVAKLLGVKTVINEFVAYKRLSEYVDEGSISRRAEVISTYALCGFANIGSMGVQLGVLGSLAPTRKQDVAEVVFRALCTATVACFMTACVAGMLLEDDFAQL